MRNTLIDFRRTPGFPFGWTAVAPRQSDQWSHPVVTSSGWGTLMSRLKSSGVLNYGFREEIAETMVASCRAAARTQQFSQPISVGNSSVMLKVAAKLAFHHMVCTQSPRSSCWRCQRLFFNWGDVRIWRGRGLYSQPLVFDVCHIFSFLAELAPRWWDDNSGPTRSALVRRLFVFMDQLSCQPSGCEWCEFCG